MTRASVVLLVKSLIKEHFAGKYFGLALASIKGDREEVQEKIISLLLQMPGY